MLADTLPLTMILPTGAMGFPSSQTTVVANQELKMISAEKAALFYETTSVQYALIDNGKLILSGQTVKNDMKGKQSLTKDTLYGIGSISKVYTAAAVMKLVDERKVDLDAPVIHYVSNFKMKDERYKRITPRILVVDINGLTSGQAGLILLPAGVAVAILSPFVGRLSDRFGDKRLIIIGMSLMMISTLFMSTIASGASPIWVSIGALVAGIAYAFTNSPTNNAAIGFLKADQVGIGAGIFQGALYLGAGTGTGIIGALLSARRDADQSFNPFYMLEAISYSDAFLAATTAGLIALIAGLGIRGNRQQ